MKHINRYIIVSFEGCTGFIMIFNTTFLLVPATFSQLYVTTCSSCTNVTIQTLFNGMTIESLNIKVSLYQLRQILSFHCIHIDLFIFLFIFKLDIFYFYFSSFVSHLKKIANGPNEYLSITCIHVFRTQNLFDSCWDFPMSYLDFILSLSYPASI